MAKKKLSMYDTFQHRGYWWIPSNTDRKVAGILTFSMDGINLELFDTLNPEKRSFGMEVETYEFVVGDCDGGEITLYDGFQTNLKMSHIITTKLTFNRMLVGKHFKTVEEMNFHSASINFSYIEEWMQHHPFEDNYIREGNRFIGAGVTYSFPPIFEAIIKSIDAKVKAGYHFNTDGELYKTKTFQHIGSLQLVPNTTREINWFLENIHELQDLLSFLMNRAIYPKRIELKGEIIDSENNRRESIILYLLPMSDFKETSVHPSEIFIDFKKIEENIEEVLNNWFKDEIKSAKKIYLRNLYDASGNWETRFLNLTKAIESFHRDTTGDAGKFLSDDDYVSIKQQMLAALPEDMDSSLKSKLRSTLEYAHQHGFERRARDIFKGVEDSVRQLIFDTPSGLKQFAVDVTKSRDYYTHFGDKPGFLLQEWGLYFASIRLNTVLLFHVCKFLAIKDDTIRNVINEDFNLVHKLETAKVELPN